MTLTPTPARTNAEGRWQFIRDVLVFQVKLLLDNVRDFALVPVSLGAAIIDLIFKGEREGSLFYKVLRWGAHSEEVIGREHQSRDGSGDRSGALRNREIKKEELRFKK